MTFRFACKTSDVPRSECREFHVGGRRILVCEYAGDYYAHSPVCTHQEYSLDGACLRDGEIECPWHFYRYDVVTGENVFPRAMCPTGDPELSKSIAALGTYPVKREGDEIYVGF